MNSNPSATTIVSDSDIQVTLKINSQAGHDVFVHPLPSALSVIQEQAVKFGKWIYVAGKRVKFELKDIPNSIAAVRKAIVEAPVKEVRMTGSLRGGADYASMTVLQLRAAAKGKVKGASLLNKDRLIAALQKLTGPATATAGGGEYDKVNVINLRKLAAERNIAGRGTMSRAQLIAALSGPSAAAEVKLALEDSREYVPNANEAPVGVFTWDKAKGLYRFYKSSLFTRDAANRYLAPLFVAAQQA